MTLDGLNKYQPYALTALRVITALTFAAHGTQKMFNFPASQGPGGGFELFSLMGLAGVLEVFGGLALAALLGFVTWRISQGENTLGDLLGAFGLVGMVEDGPTTGQLDGGWAGSPGEFSLAAFEGLLKVEVGEGALLEVEPGGGGRVLGLISLAEIPRRLTLDFKDFFNKGFGFNSMAGEFVFADGVARTDLLQINGPAAEIRVSGSTNLRSQQYDQRIEVLPKAGGVLPALGAIAGGPVGAAIGAAANAVLQKPLKQAARTVYHVTGDWTDPVVEVVEKGPPAAPPPPREP